MSASSNQHNTSPTNAGKPLGFADTSWGNVLCRYGIHSAELPIAGMPLREVRAALQRFWNIDPHAVALVNGRRLADDDIIGDGVECLAFVKPSSIIGG